MVFLILVFDPMENVWEKLWYAEAGEDTENIRVTIEKNTTLRGKQDQYSKEHIHHSPNMKTNDK